MKSESIYHQLLNSFMSKKFLLALLLIVVLCLGFKKESKLKKLIHSISIPNGWNFRLTEKLEEFPLFEEKQIATLEFVSENNAVEFMNRRNLSSWRCRQTRQSAGAIIQLCS